jgi:LPS sulfotransferase NodH
LGRPTEYFHAEALRVGRGVADYPLEPEAQLALIPKMGATPNGVYGLKLFAHHFDAVAASRWAERLPALSFIHLERRDLLGQAISHCRALQTRQWTSSYAAQATPVYNGAAINAELLRLVQAQTRWRYYFARNAPPLLHLVYEDALRDPGGAVAAVGRLVGLAETPCIGPDALAGQEIQRDALSQAWRIRFLAEARNLGHLF